MTSDSTPLRQSSENRQPAGTRKFGMPRGSPDAHDLIGEKIAEIGSDGAIVFDAARIAPLLGLSPSRMMAELQRGSLYQVSETGTGADAGRTRVTFRYRARQVALIIDGVGRTVGLD